MVGRYTWRLQPCVGREMLCMEARENGLAGGQPSWPRREQPGPGSGQDRGLAQEDGGCDVQPGRAGPSELRRGRIKDVELE